jgi:hypothetical protein
LRKRVSPRAVVLALVVVACTAAGATSVAFAVARAHSSAPPAGVRVTSGASLATGGPKLLFINAIPDKTFRQLAVAPMSSPNDKRALAGLACDRVYFAAGNGLCLTAAGAFASHYVAKIFDASFNVRKEFTIAGIPSRARVSPSGRLGSLTTFVNGHSYSPGTFSTQTLLIDMTTGAILANLEKFTVLRDGKRIHNRNFNFWGVTFARDDDHFYATLGSGGNTYLVHGSIRARTMRVLYTHLECPSLSPDGTRIAFKRSLNSHGSWRIYVLNLSTMHAHPLSETKSVDDQVEWQDNEHVLYGREGSVWIARADGGGSPSKLVLDSWSPVVVRA